MEPDYRQSYKYHYNATTRVGLCSGIGNVRLAVAVATSIEKVNGETVKSTMVMKRWHVTILKFTIYAGLSIPTLCPWHICPQ